MTLPEALQNSLNLILHETTTAHLAVAVEALTASYGAGAEAPRARQQQAFATATARLAYLAARMPATFAAVERAIAEAALTLPDFAPKSQLDLGAGPATAVWAALENFSSLEKITCIEQDGELARLGRELAAEAPRSLREASWRVGEARQTLRKAPAHEQWELVTCAYVLNELERSEAIDLAREAWRRCSGLLVIVEPGTPKAFPALSALREALLRDGAHLIAPCPSSDACPALAAGDWCHFAARLERSRLHRQIKGGELSYEDEKYSYLAFSRTPASATEARLVRHPQKLTGHVKLQLCAAGRMMEIGVGKSKKELYKSAKKMDWGSALAGEGWRELIEAATKKP